MRNGLVTVLAGAGAVVFATTVLAAEPTQVERVQAALDAWLAARAPLEKVTGIAAYISFGAAGPAIEAFAGKVGRDPDAGPVDQDTLYQMGSTSKSFTVAVILQLEAAGKLSIDETLSEWLPEYPAWKDVTIRRLLDMTSGIPTFCSTPRSDASATTCRRRRLPGLTQAGSEMPYRPRCRGTAVRPMHQPHAQTLGSAIRCRGAIARSASNGSVHASALASPLPDRPGLLRPPTHRFRTGRAHWRRAGPGADSHGHMDQPNETLTANG
ncbi:MAG TPA: serine hydrolase [Arthrobacter sp.]|nr:serine hydrolase [Arthrobacter sp.]